MKSLKEFRDALVAGNAIKEGDVEYEVLTHLHRANTLSEAHGIPIVLSVGFPQRRLMIPCANKAACDPNEMKHALSAIGMMGVAHIEKRDRDEFFRVMKLAKKPEGDPARVSTN